MSYSRGINQASACRQLSLNKFVAFHEIQPVNALFLKRQCLGQSK